MLINDFDGNILVNSGSKTGSSQLIKRFEVTYLEFDFKLVILMK